MLKLKPKKKFRLKNKLQTEAFLVDVRTPQEFAEGSVKGAVNIPLDEVESRLNEFKGKPSVIVFVEQETEADKRKRF